jgi:hypothetical protein
MDDGLTREATAKLRRVGLFGEYTVQGFLYYSNNRPLGWHVSSSLAQRSVRRYWISGGRLESVKFSESRDMRCLIEIMGPADAPAKEKLALLKAIASWEDEAGKSLAD